MMDKDQVKDIVEKVLAEQHLLGLNKIFEKEHNLFRGSHDKLELSENVKQLNDLLPELGQVPEGEQRELLRNIYKAKMQGFQ